MEPAALSDTDLLAIEIDTLWTRDERGRLVKAGELYGAPAPHLVVAVSLDRRLAAVGSEVPADLAIELIALVEGAVSAPADPPAGLSSWVARLERAMGPVEVASGPSYVAASPPVASSAASLIRFDGAKRYEEALEAPERAGWEPEEWRMLLAGELGPWAMATMNGQVIAICFSPRLTDVAAEAGVWTDPDHRGRGHAAAVTAAWASLVLPTGRHAFYSTSASNLSSQRVAARLGLRPIGWMWKVDRARG